MSYVIQKPNTVCKSVKLFFLTLLINYDNEKGL